MGARSELGGPSLAISPFSWMDAVMEGVGERVGQMMETEVNWEPEDERPRRKALSMEDLRRKYSWWPSGASKEAVALIQLPKIIMTGLKCIPLTLSFEIDPWDQLYVVFLYTEILQA